MIMDEDGAQFVGPVVTSERSADAVIELIETWWATTRTSKPDTPRGDSLPPDGDAVAAERDGAGPD